MRFAESAEDVQLLRQRVGMLRRAEPLLVACRGGKRVVGRGKERKEGRKEGRGEGRKEGRKEGKEKKEKKASETTVYKIQLPIFNS